MDSLDKFDLAILDILQKDNTTSQKVIGEVISLSAPAVQRRIKRMQKSGVIQSNVSIINPEKIKQSITVIVELELYEESLKHLDDAKNLFNSTPEVQQCYYVTGDTDYILIMIVSSMSHYESLTRKLFFNNTNVKHFKTHVVMNRAKVGLNVPLD
ncbi:Lrp/AsnC family transcriptional regulator (plasmid) [Chondrinema litorale]|nr:Lrp/AsnC family transcriptional regulator [Chondrinema litorale]UZR96598.1 Lrp/AsnC family transcriptional regulator [Chondrinema litorale]